MGYLMIGAALILGVIGLGMALMVIATTATGGAE
jgi:hypothetical protein